MVTTMMDTECACNNYRIIDSHFSVDDCWDTSISNSARASAVSGSVMSNRSLSPEDDVPVPSVYGGWKNSVNNEDY